MSIIIDKDNEYGFRVFGDGGEDSSGVAIIRSASASIPALVVGRSVNGNASQAAFRIEGSSVASGSLMGFAGGMISCTSVVLTSVANIDYVIPINVGAEARYIPVLKAAAIIGAAV